MPDISLPKINFRLAAAALVLLAAVGAAYYFFYFKRPVPDTTPPELYLSSPTAESWYATDEPSATIEGFAVDSGSGVKQVSWETSGGGNGTAEVGSDNSWQIKGVSFSEGDNTVTIKAKDAKGNETEITLNVVYNPGVLFYNLTLSEDFVYKDAPLKGITVRSGVEVGTDKVIDEVALYRLENGEKERIAEMLDNGVVSNGDDIPGDGVYSVINGFSSDTLDPINLRIGVVLEGSVEVFYSGVLPIRVLEKMTAEQAAKVLEVNESINSKFEEFKSDSKSGEEAAKKMVEWLKEREGIADAGISENGTGVWWQYRDNGILVGVSNYPDNRRSTPRESSESTGEDVRGVADTIISVPVRFGLSSPAYAAEGDLEVKSTKAIYLGPYNGDFGATDDYNKGWQTIIKSKCPKCQTTEKKDGNVTVEDFKALSNYGLVIIPSHGDTWFRGVFGSAGGQVVVLTSQKLTEANVFTYLPDLLSGRLALRADNTLVILPSFIRAYNGTFPNSLVYIGSCRSGYNFTMASAFLSKGAKAYFGFGDYVKSDWAGDVAGTMIESFIDKGKTAQEAFNDAVAAHGTDDGDGDGYARAFFNFWGRGDLKMGGKDVQNGSFEEGLLGWNAEGDARVINSLAALKPQHESRMAIISTGLGSVNDSNSAVAQTLCSKEGKLSVSFKYNVVSEEPMEWVGSQFDDKLVVTVFVNDSPTVILERTINNSSWIPVSGIDFAGGDSTTYMTGWVAVSQEIGEITKDDSVTVEFRVSDKGDSIYDTAALLDDVKIEVN